MKTTRLNLLFRCSMIALLFCAPSWGSEQPRYPGNPAVADTSIYLSHNGLSRFDLNTLRPVWRSLNGVATLEPVVTSLGILVGSTSGLYAIDGATGTIRWQIDATTTLFSPAVRGNITYVGGVDGSLRAIDLSNRQTLWHTQFTGWIYAPAIVGNHLVVGGGANEARGVDSRNGRELWTRKLPQEMVYRPIVAHDQQVVITTFDGNITSLDPKNGSVLWRVHDSVPSFSPLVVDDLLVFGTFDGRVRAIDSSIGNMRCRCGLGPCVVFPDKLVSTKGWCSNWRQKAG